MNIYDTFTSNSDHVSFNPGEFEIYHPTKSCVGGREDSCNTCPFQPLDSCFVNTSSEDFQPIYDFFQAHYPEKLL